MKNTHKLKKNTILYCMKELRDEELGSEKKSVERIREFEGYRKHKMRKLNSFESKLEYLKDYEEDLLEQV